jgi:hypothetical protein
MSRAGRIIGVLIILQMVGSGLVNFALRNPAPQSRQMGLAVLLGLVTTAMLVGVAVTAFPILWQRSRTMALWILSLAVVSLAVTVMENLALLSSMSSTSDTQDWAHYLAKIFDGLTTLVFYAALFRFALVPRLLAGFGLIAAPLMIASLAMPLFGHDVVFPMLAPLGLSQLILALWLLAKGFPDQ